MSVRRTLAMLSLASLVCLAAASPRRAQDVINKEGAAAGQGVVPQRSRHDARQVRRPRRGVPAGQVHLAADGRRALGVRSADAGGVRRLQLHPELVRREGAPTSARREEAAKLRTLTDKAQVIEHLNKGFAHAKKELEALDPATLTGERKIMISPNPLAITDIALGVGGDLHEHLGQMIAYARMNHIVPPWSK